MKVTIKRQKQPTGFHDCLLGFSVRDPILSDKNGVLITESPLFNDVIAKIPFSFIRQTAGSHTYNIQSTADPGMNFTLSEFLLLVETTRRKLIKNDFTWPPQLSISTIGDWVSKYTQRITLFNEPPNEIPTVFSSAQDCIDQQVAMYNDQAVSSLRNKIWIQTGKPEIVRYPNGPGNIPQLVAKHQACLDATKVAIDAGLLPNRIVSTHKISDAYPDDRYSFYKELINDYKIIFGETTKVCFQEVQLLNAGEGVDPDAELFTQILLYAEFILICCKIRSQDQSIDGAAFHEMFAAGRANVINLENPQDKEWSVGSFFLFVDLFFKSISLFQHRPGSIDSEDDGCISEFFTYNNTNFILYSNRRHYAIDLGNLNTRSVTLVDSNFRTTTLSYPKQLPARTIGVVELKQQIKRPLLKRKS